MIKTLKQMLEYAYRTKRYRLAASIAMLSEYGWYANDLTDAERAIVEQAKRVLSQPNLTRKAVSQTKPMKPPTLPEVVAEVQPQPKGKTQPRAEPKRFRKPTVEQIAAYCRERNNGVNAHQFWDFYEAKGWLIGKNPMKDWKAAVRTWEQRDGREQKQTKRGATPAPAEKIQLWD